MKPKVKKSISKRIRVTRTGKLIRRPMGVDHFRARQTSKSIRSKRTDGRIHDRDVQSILKQMTKTAIS